MRRTDDNLSEEDTIQIRLRADTLMRKTGVYDILPTPTDRIVRTAGLRVDNSFFTESDVLSRMASAPAEKVRLARGALVGLVDIEGATIYVRPEISLLNLPPLVLHEVAHAYLEWQRDLYRFVQEDEASGIAHSLRDRFELEANQFAWELIFQCDRFQRDAERCPFSLDTPVKLADRYGTSVYAAVRWFVATSGRPCALFVYSRQPGVGMRARRPVQSPGFTRRFGALAWTQVVKRGGTAAFLAGYDARYTVHLPDLEGRIVDCELHSLTTADHSFTLLYPTSVISMISLPRAFSNPAMDG